MNVTRFILAVHCHQPVGNFNWVFEEAYQKAYKPFVDLLERHPNVRVVFHYSGSLLDWVRQKHPDFLKRLKALVRRGQAEFLGSGYYEPILVMVPDRDALAQLGMMRGALKKFGLEGGNGTKAAHGIWLSERVWEPGLVPLLSKAGVAYAIVDDHHLALAGVKEEDRFGYHLTEDRGDTVALFPSLKKLRYAVPFNQVDDVIRILKEFRSERPRTVVLADDGEKFGLWPGTQKWVYEEGWLERFFRELEKNRDWLKMTTFREALEQTTPLGRVYVPVASYEEMLGWSGGSFRNFLAKYPEADAMHKKMLWLSGCIAEAKGGPRMKTSSAASSLRQAQDHLYMAQSNDAYWHGVFGGLYLKHLRRAVYGHLLEAEKIMDGLHSKRPWVCAEEADFDADNEEEVSLRSKGLTLLADSNRGAQLIELSDKGTGINLIDTLSRKPEAYHGKLAGKKNPVHASAGQKQMPLSIHDQEQELQPELADLLVYDRTRRVSLIDHVFSPSASFQNFARGTEPELGDFVEGDYQARVVRGKGNVSAVFTRQGNVFLKVGGNSSLTVTKKITLSKNVRGFDVGYRLSNPAGEPKSFLFGSEWNLTLKDAHVNRIGDAQGVSWFSVADPALRLKISWSYTREARLWYFPVETVSDSEKGMERNYQGACLAFLWDVHVPARGAWEVRCAVKIESADEKSQS